MKKEYAIEMKNIIKKFGNFVANDNISLKIEKGSIHAIIGENGAGKTTLINQLFGLLKPTSGEIYINQKQTNISSPNDANMLGLSMVHQHFQLVKNHTILENIILGDEKSPILMPIDYKRAKFKLLNISKKYNLEINPDQLVKKVSVGVQQRIEILKMLYREANIFIFDEPTAMLTPQEIDGLLKLFLDFKKQGKTIVFISHKLEEIKKVADNATVIRKGKVIASFSVAKTSVVKMAELMVGRKLVKVKNKSKTKPGDTILSVKNLFVKNYSNPKAMGLKNFSLDIKAGETTAIAGVEGNGQLELINAIFGLQRVAKGQILIKNIKSKEHEMILLKSHNVLQRYKNGVSLVPEDRYRYAMLSAQNMFTNAIFQVYREKPYSVFGFLARKPKTILTNQIIQNFDVRGARAGFAVIGDLSGGNQQKFIVGREMIKPHQILILFQPTRGLDIGATEFTHHKILEEKAKGNAVLLVSYELSEIMSLADKIAVLNQGSLINVAKASGLAKEKIGQWMAGVK